ncbi:MULTISPECIES: FecCD family ABC transporter permease [Dethiosulfovibrio]|uniref:Iron ABC transporter permease n=2 Tax=Dethiosulfovibrio TaxID=47054 RepID=A0ABS9EJ62_9BACT|nr:MULTISPECIES: iron ABC transporter permease [Dethiosulfovibrio]MCF4112773.1 iron ABC transporter permease [Dethiosulfovibrio russensis]MCF4141237.1 iron ABC transporter permease [Dethiosulfovibrio marinus]MCF4144923.1 iron ABC transporter permease [Dethiosulfovibrio acidaminovorans]
MSCSTTESSSRSLRSLLPWILLPMALVIVALAGLCLGSASIPVSSIWAIFSGGDVSSSWKTIVLDLRLPRVVSAILAGAALSSSGLIMQTLFGNGLAGPSVLGVSSGASLGAALALLLAPGDGLISRLGLLGCSFAGAFITMMLVALIGERVKRGGTLLILGLMIGYTVNAVVSVLIQWAPSERVHGFVSWSFGTFSGIGWDRIPWMASSVFLGLALAFVGRRFWDAFLLGETCAATVGADVPRIRRRMILISALLAGTVTAFCGPVAFLGVAVPHMARGISGSARHGRLLPVTVLCGASLAVAADLLSRLPGGASSLPLNSVTSLIGAPVVAWVVFRGGDR